MIVGFYSIMLKTEKCWDPMHYVCSCIRRYPYSITRVWTRTSIRQAKYRYVLHNAAVTITNSNGCSAKVELLKKARPTRKGASGVRTDW